MTDYAKNPAAAETAAAIRKAAGELEDQIISWRRHLHAHPEVGAHEVQTSAFVREQLDKLGVPYRMVKGARPEPYTAERPDFIGTGIIATIAGAAPGAYDENGNPARRIALRTDMDRQRAMADARQTAR